MNKSGLIEAIAGELNVHGRLASGIVETILQTMIDSMAKGDNIEIRGFGSFQVREYKSYTGRNPKTGEKIEIKPKKMPFFKVGKDLKELVDG